MTTWHDANDLPPSEREKWSKDVIAVTLSGEVFKIACFVGKEGHVWANQGNGGTRRMGSCGQVDGDARAMTTWCATGHRPDKLGGYGLQTDQRLASFAHWYFSMHRPDRFISGMAQGWDLACAGACIQLGIPFVAAVPCAGQESRWPTAAQERYRSLLAKAERVHTVSATYSAKAMQDRNEWMVDNSDGVVALWDGSSGGTGNCMRYAEAKGASMINLWPWWASFKRGMAS